MATTVTASLKEANANLRPLGRLVRFFAKYPPSQYSAAATGQAIPTMQQRTQMDAKALSSTSLPQASSIPSPVAAQNTSTQTPDFPDMIPPPSRAAVSPLPGVSSTLTFPPNPFLPYKNPETGRWRGARIGLRQQADLFKAARKLDVEEYLPPSIKSSAYKQQRALERGLAVKGTGEGQKVKGHKWERTMAATLEKRRKAMEDMPEMIRQWEQRGHGRGWKKYPR